MIGKYKKLKLLTETSTGPIWLIKDNEGREYTAKFFPSVHENKLEELIPKLKVLKNERLAKCIDGFKDEAADAYVMVTEYFSSKPFIIF